MASESVKNLWEEELEKVFNKTRRCDEQTFMDILSIIIFNRFDSNLGKLYTIIGDMNLFSKLVEEFSDTMFKFPNSDDLRNAIVTALCYYYREIKHLSWVEVQKLLPYEKDVPIHYGKTIATINRDIKRQLDELLTEQIKPKEEPTFFED